MDWDFFDPDQSFPLSDYRMSSPTNVPGAAAAAILQPSHPVPEGAVPVQGPDFEKPLSLDGFLQSYERIGFQANSLGKAIKIVNAMVCLSIFMEHNHSVKALVAQMASLR